MRFNNENGVIIILFRTKGKSLMDRGLAVIDYVLAYTILNMFDALSVLDFVLDEIKKVEFIPSLKDVKVIMNYSI